MRREAVVAIGILSAAVSAKANIIISEVDPAGSSTSTYKQDWFELTNTGTSAQDITGWKMDDNSDAFSTAVPLSGVTSIAAGASVVFIEDTGVSDDAALEASFKTAWFGMNVPTGFTIGTYGGSGVGLSSTADGVNIFNAGGGQVTGVLFGASTSGTTFDNSAGLGATSSDPTISTLSVSGTNSAFTAPSGEIGSPGTIANAVPEPTTLALLPAAMLVARRRRASK